MIKTIKELKEAETTVDVICHKCGESCKGSIGNFNGLIEAKVTGAYDSTHLTDLTLYEFSICEKCLMNIFKSFIIPPKETDLCPAPETY